MAKEKNWTLRNIPKDVRDYVLDQQLEYKKGCNCIISLEQTIFKLILKLKKSSEDGKTNHQGTAA